MHLTTQKTSRHKRCLEDTIIGFAIWAYNRYIITSPTMRFMTVEVFISYFTRIVWLVMKPVSPFILTVIHSLLCSIKSFIGLSLCCWSDLDFRYLLCHQARPSAGTKHFVNAQITQRGEGWYRTLSVFLPSHWTVDISHHLMPERGLSLTMTV